MVEVQTNRALTEVSFKKEKKLQRTRCWLGKSCIAISRAQRCWERKNDWSQNVEIEIDNFGNIKYSEVWSGHDLGFKSKHLTSVPFSIKFK